MPLSISGDTALSTSGWFMRRTATAPSRSRLARSNSMYVSLGVLVLDADAKPSGQASAEHVKAWERYQGASES